MKKYYNPGYISEDDVEDYLIQETEKIGGMCIKGNPHNQRGMPDRIMILAKGLIVFMEVKRPFLKPRPNQRKTIKDFKALGHNAGYVNSYSMVDNLIKWCINKIKTPTVVSVVAHTCLVEFCNKRRRKE